MPTFHGNQRIHTCSPFENSSFPDNSSTKDSIQSLLRRVDNLLSLRRIRQIKIVIVAVAALECMGFTLRSIGICWKIFMSCFLLNVQAQQNITSSILGCGVTSSVQFFQEASAMYSFVEPNSSVSYSMFPPIPYSGQSSASSCFFTTDDDFQVQWLPTANQSEPSIPTDDSSSATVRIFPIVSGSIVPIYNIPELQDVTDKLVVDLSLLALIYLGHVNRWNDHRILSLNPRVSHLLPNETILVGSRAEPSRTTYVFTAALASGAVSFWCLTLQKAVSGELAWGSEAQSIGQCDPEAHVARRGLQLPAWSAMEFLGSAQRSHPLSK